ncbi:MAG: hypothetical protein M3Q23_12570 [Actinomycetota bacterium]|nr:hypothetical protein [Actinomycetota bacterium]
MSFVDRLHGWALGWFRQPKPGLVTMQRTDDGGQTWQLVTPPTTEPGQVVTQVRFDDRENGWAFGLALYATHDGGSTWTRERLGGPVAALQPAGQTVWAVARGRLWTSRPGADRWHRVPGAPLIRGSVSGLARNGPDRAWLLWSAGGPPDRPASHLMATFNGGKTWERLAVPCGKYSFREQLAAAGRSLWLFCGDYYGAGSERGRLYRSLDEGRSWGAAGPEMTFLCCPHMFPRSARTVWVDNAYPLIVSHDSGRTWRETLEASGAGWGVLFPASHAILAWTERFLYLSADDGRHWRHLRMTPSGCG